MSKCLFTIFIIAFSTNIFSQKILIDPISAQSLKFDAYKDSTYLSSSTGFIVSFKNKYYLITNWHSVSGIDFYTNRYLDSLGRVPNSIIIHHNADTLGRWLKCKESLIAEGQPRYHYLALNKNLVDVIALPILNIPPNIKIYPFDLDLDKTDMLPQVAMPVSIVGFPYGQTGFGNFTIWKTGHIATDPSTDYDNLPMFLVDATTRPGMSGSPVILRLWGGFDTISGNSVLSQSGPSTLFLGIYSAQSLDSEIGLVWKSSVIRKLLETIK